MPGTDTTSSSLAYQFKSARNLYTESRKVDPSLELASIIWIGYEAPTGPVKTGFVKAAFRRRARIGGDRLVCDVAAFHATRRRAGTATPDKLVNRLYGHSYGSVTTCYAGRGGRLAGLIGSVILSGSPGAGPLDHAEDFGIGAHNVYVLASWRDPVTMFGADEPGAGSRYHRGLGLGIDPATEAFGGQRLGAEFPDSPDFAGVEAVHQGYLHYDPVTGQPNEALFHSAHITAGRGDTLTRVPPRRAGRVAFRPIDAERDRYADLGGDSAPGTGNTGGSADPGGLIGSRPHDEELLPNERSALAHRLTERRAELLRELSALLAPHGIDPAELLRTGSPTWAAWFTRYQEVRRDLVAGLEIDRGAAVDDRWIRHVLAEWREQGVATPEILSAGREFDRILPVAALVDDIQRLDDWARTVEALEAELTRRTVELSVLLGRVQGMLGTIADFRPAGVLVAILDSALATADRLAAARQRLEQHAHDLHSSGTAVAERERTTFTPSDEEILSAARPYRLSSLDSWHGMALLHARLQYLVAAAEDPGNELSVPDDIAELHRLAARSQAAVARYETTQLLDTGLDVTLDLVKRMLAGLPTAAGGTAWQLSEFSDSAPFEQRLTAVRDDVAKRWRHQVATAHLGRETSRARTRLSRIDTVTAALDEAGHRITLGRKMLIRQMSEHLRKYPLDRRMDRGQLEPDLMTILNAVRVCEAALPGDGWAESTPAQLRRRVDRLRGDAETAQVADQAERYLSLRLLVAAFEDATPWIHWLYELVGHSRSLERLTDRPAAETGSTRDPTAESGRFDADLDEWLDAALVTVGRAGGLAVMPEGSVGSRPSAYDIAGATAGLTERPAPEDPGLVLDFDPADRDRADAAVAALAELLRARGWRNTVHAAAAPELARRAIADARDYLDAYRAELPRHLGSIPEDRRARALQDLDIRLTARLSTAADGSRSLHLSVECPQYRPPYRPYEPHGAAWPAPLHSARHVGPAVRELLSSATRAGIEQWGEVWADFTEPPPARPRPCPRRPPPLRGEGTHGARAVRRPSRAIRRLGTRRRTAAGAGIPHPARPRPVRRGRQAAPAGDPHRGPRRGHRREARAGRRADPVARIGRSVRPQPLRHPHDQPESGHRPGAASAADEVRCRQAPPGADGRRPGRGVRPRVAARGGFLHRVPAVPRGGTAADVRVFPLPAARPAPTRFDIRAVAQSASPLRSQRARGRRIQLERQRRIRRRQPGRHRGSFAAADTSGPRPGLAGPPVSRRHAAGSCAGGLAGRSPGRHPRLPRGPAPGRRPTVPQLLHGPRRRRPRPGRRVVEPYPAGHSDARRPRLRSTPLTTN